jgi:hypothetical protein
MKWFHVLTVNDMPVGNPVMRTVPEAEAEYSRLTERYPEPMIGARIAVKCEEESSLFLTRAPEAYDGFGTYTVKRFDNSLYRVVDIAKRHEVWQRSMYGSGLYASSLLREAMAAPGRHEPFTSEEIEEIEAEYNRLTNLHEVPA